MATPVILVNNTGGSDSLASGAGPATAITGSLGRTRNTASQLHVGLFGATDDFSGVAVDGSAVLYIAIATAGARNFSSIAAFKNTRETGNDAAITATTAILVVGSTTGWTAADVIKVTGAGAAGADLYSTILTVDSAIQATLNDNAGTTVAAAAWENPKQPTLTTGQGLNTGATNTAWAIGGKRASIGSASSKKLADNNSAAGDAMAGWIIEMQSGHSETIAATYEFRRSGSSTAAIQLRAESGAGTRPLLTFSNNTDCLSFRGQYQQFRDFELRNTNATKTASRAIIASTGAAELSLYVKNIKVSHSTNKFWKGICPTFDNMTVESCEVGYCASIGIDAAANGGAINVGGPHILNNWVHDCGGGGIILGSNNYSGALIKGNGVYNITGIGISVDNSEPDNRGTVIIEENVVDTCSSDGLKFVTASVSNIMLRVWNNISSNNGGYGFNFSAAGFTTAFRDASNLMIRNNNTYNNTGGAYNPASYGSADPGLDPALVSVSTGNFQSNVLGLQSVGFPTDLLGTTGAGRTYEDIGMQQQPSSGGGSAVAIFG